MLRMLLTENQERMRANLSRMVQERVIPRAAEIDEKDDVPMDLLNVFSEMGIFSILVPEEFGGLGGGLTELCLAIEEIAKGSVSCVSSVLGQAVGSLVLIFAGNEEQKAKYFPRIMKDGYVALGLTEPQGGSDLGAITTKAILNGDCYIVNGRKAFITQGGYAEGYITLVRTDPETVDRKGLSFLWIEKGTEGFGTGKEEKRMGHRGSSSTELIFDDAKVPRSQLLGEEGKGMDVATKLLSYTRPAVAVWAIGNAEGALENAIRFIKTRPQFGKMVSEFQAIRFAVSELATKIELARSLIYRIASMVDHGTSDDIITLASMAKWFSTDVGMEVTTQAVQMMGSYGYSVEYPVERMMRDAKGLQIAEGSNEIQKVIIARNFLD